MVEAGAPVKTTPSLAAKRVRRAPAAWENVKTSVGLLDLLLFALLSPAVLLRANALEEAVVFKKRADTCGFRKEEKKKKH